MNVHVRSMSLRSGASRGLCVAACLAALSCTAAHAQSTLFWSSNNATQGGSGTWSNGSGFWGTTATGPYSTNWNNSNNDSARFGGTAGTVTLGSGITVGGLWFDTTGYAITNSGNTLTFGAANNAITLNNIAAATITGQLGGTGNVTLSTTNPATASTLTLNGTSTGGWSGTTTINPGVTLALTQNNQGLLNTSGITLAGGNIAITNTTAGEALLNRVSNTAPISSAGSGTFTWTNTAASGRVYAETIGTVDLVRGQLNFLEATNQGSGGGNMQTLTLGTSGSGLTRTGGTNTSVVSFGAASGLNTTTNIIQVFGASGTGSSSGQVIGPWAFYGTTPASPTDYAVYDASGRVLNASIGATAENSGSWVAGANVTLNAPTSLTATRTVNTLRYTGSAGSLALGANNLETYGLLNGGAGLTVSGTGALTTPSGGGYLYLTPGAAAITVSAPINDNGGAVTLVKSGSNTVTLSSTTGNFSGGVVLNAGTLAITNNLNLGSGGGIVVNGTATIDAGDQYSLARTLTLNEGASLTSVNGFGVTGVFSGNGTLSVTSADDHNFTNAANTFNGTINSATAGTTSYGLTFASIGDGAGAGLINLAGGSGTFRWTSASGNTTTLANRQFALSSAGGVGTNMTTISALGTTAASNLVISKDLLVTGTAGARALRLAGTNTGNNTFAGRITDGTDGGPSVVTIVKEQAGTWILSGNNSYTGGTTVSAGALQAGAANVLSSGAVTVTGGSLQIGTFNQAPGAVTITGGTIDGSTGVLSGSRTLASAGTISAIVGGSGDLYKYGTGTTSLTRSNSFSGGVTVGGGTLAVGASSTLGANTAGNSIAINDAGVLTLAAAANSGSNQAITFSSSSKSGRPISETAGGAGPVGRLGVLGLGFNGLPNGAISQANTNGGVIAINGVTGYNTDLSAVLSGKNLYVGAIGTSTFTGSAGTIVAGNGSLYRLGGGGGQITFNNTNLFTGGNAVQVGSTFVNGGGTVVVSAAQDYTGVTTVSQGTLTFNGTSGAATGSSGFTLNGGRLFLDNATNNSDRIGNAAAVTLSNGGEFSLSGNSAGTTEAFGNLNLGAGYSTVTVTAATTASTLAGGNFTRTNSGTALFRGTALGQNTTIMGRVTLTDTSGLSFVGASTSNNATNGDTTKDIRIIPYLVGDTAANGNGNTFVTYDTTTGFRVLNTTNQFNTTVTAGTNVRLGTLQTGIGTASINSLIIANTGSSTIADGATLTVASGAVLFSSGGTIAPAGTTGILDFGSAEGVVTTTAATSVISARITGSGGLTKAGTGSLTLSSANNSFSGGIRVNSGTLIASVDANLGAASNTITVNGSSTLNLGSVSYARDLIMNNGSVVTFGGGGNPTISGNLTGSGGVAHNNGFGTQNFFTGTGNTFEGAILIGSSGTGGQAYRMQFASLTDSATANGRIVFLASSVTHNEGSVFEYTGGTGGNTSLSLNNRQIELASVTGNPTNGHQIRNNSAGTGTLSIATDLIVSTPIAQTLSLRGANTGANTFGGIISNGAGTVSLLKTDAGRWVLSNNNTFSGTTLISGGILELSNPLALQNSPLDATNSVTGGASAGLRTTVTTLTFGGLNGTKNLDTLFTTTSGGYGGVTALTLNPGAGQTASYVGAIANGASGMSLIKSGAGTQVLAGTNTYNGSTTIKAGTLKLVGAGTIANSPTIVVGDTGSSGAVLDLSDKSTFSIGASQTLMGIGTVRLGTGDTLTIAGTLSPGNSPGLITLDTQGGGGTVNLAGTTLMEIWGTSRGGSPGYDAVDITNDTTLNFGGILELDFDQLFADNTTFDLFTTYDTSSLGSNFSSLTMTGSEYLDLTFTDNAGLWTSNVGANNQYMTFSTATGVLSVLPVPEPAAMALLGAGIAVLGIAGRRRFSKKC